MPSRTTSPFVFIPVLLDSKTPQREKELARSNARKHAARVVFERKEQEIEANVSRKRQRPCPSCDVSHGNATCKRSTFSVLGPFEGNSDPFHSQAIAVNPKVTEVLQFFKHAFLPAVYGTAQSTASAAIEVRRNVQRLEFALGTGFLDDACCAQSFTYAYMTAMSRMGGDESMAQEALKWKGQSLRALRQKLQSDERFDIDSAATSVMMLFTAAVFSEDFEEARVHGASLGRLICQQLENKQKINPLLLARTLWLDAQLAELSMTRSAIEAGQWLPNMIADAISPIEDQMSSLKHIFSADLDDSLTSEPLRSIIVQVRQSGWLWALPTPVAVKHVAETVLWVNFKLWLCRCQLVANYTRLRRIQNKDGSQYTEMVLTMTLLYHVALAAFDPKIGGTPLFSKGRSLFGHLRETAEQALVFASDNAVCWCLFVGAQTEVRRKERGWFCDSFSTFAADRGLDWKKMQRICDGFLPTGFVQPFGDLWVDELIRGRVDNGR